ncbi:18726_t:CDS:1, partial [Dentiscutata erythropus]
MVKSYNNIKQINRANKLSRPRRNMIKLLKEVSNFIAKEDENVVATGSNKEEL